MRTVSKFEPISIGSVLQNVNLRSNKQGYLELEKQSLNCFLIISLTYFSFQLGNTLENSFLEVITIWYFVLSHLDKYLS